MVGAWANCAGKESGMALLHDWLLTNPSHDLHSRLGNPFAVLVLLRTHGGYCLDLALSDSALEPLDAGHDDCVGVASDVVGCDHAGCDLVVLCNGEVSRCDDHFFPLWQSPLLCL